MVDKNLEKADKRFHENFFKKVFNRLIVGILVSISRLPFFVIYRISDVLFFLLQYVIKYRRNVILGNLQHAFPEKSVQEINSIARKFYRHLCDLMLETVKMHGMSKSQISKHIKFEGVEAFEQHYNNNRSMIVLGMHHNNWEWGSAFQLEINHQIISLYNPVRGNRAMEKFILDSREKWGVKCVPVHKSARKVLEFSKLGKPTVLWLGADQSPPATSKFWTIFLNREAPFFSGPEKVAAKTNQPVFFHHTKKVGRGKYTVLLTPLVEQPAEVEPKEILLKYIRKMEEVIQDEPEYYLWSHRRWKHNRPEDVSLTL